MAKSIAQVKSLSSKFMKNDEYAELFSYCSPESIMVVTWYGKLKTLYCPFGVKALKDIGTLRKGEYLFVDKVLLSSTGKVVFEIKNSAYYYHWFDILIHM